MDLEQLRTKVLSRELAILSSNKVVDRLRGACSTRTGLQVFANEFYPIRYSFVQLAFAVGARAPMHESYWYGLAKNLFEEGGEDDKIAHNELYRRFISSIGLDPNMKVPETALSRSFNKTWFDFVSHAPLEQAIAAIAVYEIIDSPDYSALYEALRGLSPSYDLQFFRIHSVAEHFSMFESFFSKYLSKQGNSLEDFIPVADFVLNNQESMWVELLSSIEQKISQQEKHVA